MGFGRREGEKKEAIFRGRRFAVGNRNLFIIYLLVLALRMVIEV